MGTATITEWDIGRREATSNGVDLVVDFDPGSLQLTYTPTGITGAGAVTKSGAWSKAPAQQTGQSTTLSVELTFDTTATRTSVQDKTNKIVKLTLPDDAGRKRPARRVAKFHWGSFTFYGSVESLTQTIDFFSDDGIPLRATVHLTLSDVKPPDPDNARPPQAKPVSFGSGAGTAAAGDSPVGTTPLTLSQSGDTVQSIAARSGVPWRTVAAANGIDNPRLLPPGTVLDPSARHA